MRTVLYGSSWSPPRCPEDRSLSRVFSPRFGPETDGGACPTLPLAAGRDDGLASRGLPNPTLTLRSRVLRLQH
eukprot:scaffold17243_cov61-Phaeocystis_antarctica.AAC.1